MGTATKNSIACEQGSGTLSLAATDFSGHSRGFPRRIQRNMPPKSGPIRRATCPLHRLATGQIFFGQRSSKVAELRGDVRRGVSQSLVGHLHHRVSPLRAHREALHKATDVRGQFAINSVDGPRESLVLILTSSKCTQERPRRLPDKTRKALMGI